MSSLGASALRRVICAPIHAKLVLYRTLVNAAGGICRDIISATAFEFSMHCVFFMPISHQDSGLIGRSTAHMLKYFRSSRCHLRGGGEGASVCNRAPRLT